MTNKITLTQLVNLQNETTAVNAINNNSNAITSAFDNTLSLDGTAPNQMEAELDMNSNRILNLPQPLSNSEPLRLQDLETFNHTGTISTIPAGGTTGQVLAKVNNTDYDVNWVNSAASGTVTSVGLSLPSEFTVTNSPVTSSGTLTGAWASTPTGSGVVVKNNSPTLLTPTIATINNTGTLTLPTSTDTLVGRATTDTLTNKTISGSTNTLTSFPLTALGSVSANTLVGNSSGVSASPTAFNIGGLTQKSSPTGTDLILIQDQAASGALKYAQVSSISSAGSVSSIASNTGAFTLSHGITNSTNDIRLSLANTTFQTPSASLMTPTGTSSASVVMMGLGGTCTLTPAYSTRVMLTFNGYMTNTGSGNVVAIRLYYGTGTAPSNGVAATGTQVGGIVATTVPSANYSVPFSTTAIITGLTAGTAVWFDLGLNVGSGTGSITSCSCTAHEF